MYFPPSLDSFFLSFLPSLPSPSFPLFFFPSFLSFFLFLPFLSPLFPYFSLPPFLLPVFLYRLSVFSVFILSLLFHFPAFLCQFYFPHMTVVGASWTPQGNEENPEGSFYFIS
jgi:hypothetical protein